MIRADTLVETLHLRANGAHVRIASAESCTGGMLGEIITHLPGASTFYEGGFITYSNRMKQELLGVHAATLQEFGAVSVQTAGEMATGALSRTNAHLAVSITGIAGPGSSGNKPEGLVCFGLALRGDAGLLEPETRKESTQNSLHVGLIDFGARGRAKVRALACDHALDLLIAALPDATG